MTCSWIQSKESVAKSGICLRLSFPESLPATLLQPFLQNLKTYKGVLFCFCHICPRSSTHHKHKPMLNPDIRIHVPYVQMILTYSYWPCVLRLLGSNMVKNGNTSKCRWWIWIFDDICIRCLSVCFSQPINFVTETVTALLRWVHILRWHVWW